MQWEKIVETKNCKHCNSSFEITDKDLEFYEKLSPVFWWQKYQVPSPTLCPDCRQQRRLSFRNEKKLYKRKCDATGKDIISIYSSLKPYKIYHQDYWWSDKWDAMDYGRDFDFNKNFFEQFNELQLEVPRLCLRIRQDMEDCYYCNNWNNSKGCYMCNTAINSENCYYSHTSINCNFDVDGLFNQWNSFCYNAVQSNNNFNSKFLFYSHNCKNSSFLDDCDNCEYCYGCVNLRNKKYFYLNQELTSEEYYKKIENININDFKDIFEDFSKKQIKPYTRWVNFPNSFWDFIVDCENCHNCFWVIGLKDSKYCWSAWLWSEDIYDCLHSWPVNKCYECVTTDTSSNLWFSLEITGSYNLFYCQSISNCNNCFWCIWLKNKSYCILNKQYTKEEYEELVSKIIEHMIKTWEWWEFFPSSISPFGYNETVGMEYFPLSRDEILDNRHPEFISGSIMQEFSQKHSIKDTETSSAWQFKKWLIFNRSDYEAPFSKVTKIIPASKLPDDIRDIPDDILNWAIECEITKKPFKIIKQELDFYKKHNLPIPRRHPDQRHLDRMAFRNPRKLFDRKCDKCGVDIKTTYSPDRSEIVYCEECYNKEIY